MSQLTLKAIVVSLLTAAITVPALAAEGKTPIYQPGTTITADGRYVLTRNLLNQNAAPVITIAASFVDLDLNGMVLTQSGGPFAVIAVTGNTNRVSIHDGSLYGGNSGVTTVGTVGSFIVEDVIIKGPQGPGLHIEEVGTASVRRNHISGATGPGILWDGSDLKAGAIEENSIREGGAGIVVAVRSDAVSIRNNRIAFIGYAGGIGKGIALGGGSGSEIVGNIVTQTVGEGIVLSQTRGARASSNTVMFAGTHGIHIDPNSSDNVIADNIVQNSASGHGIFVEGARNQILRNSVNVSAGGGIVFDGGGAPNFACGNTFGGNHVRLSLGGTMPTCNGGSPPNYCDAAVDCTIPNTSYGDNLIPGPPPS